MLKKHVTYFYDRILNEKGNYYNHMITYQIFYSGKLIYTKRLSRFTKDDVYYSMDEIEKIVKDDIFTVFYHINY